MTTTMTVNHGTYATKCNRCEFYVCIKYNDIDKPMKVKHIFAKSMKKAIKKVRKSLDINCTYKIKQIA